MDKSADRNTQTCGERIANALKAIHPYGSAKLISRDTGISQRTVERLLDGDGTPSLENFARLLAVYPSLIVVLFPTVQWAPLAAAAVEEAAMRTALDDASARRQSALDLMRSSR